MKSAGFAKNAPLLETMTRHRHLRLLPMAARGLWLEIAMTIMESGSAALRFGARIVGIEDLSVIAAMPTAEVEVNLALLMDSGLVWRNAEGAIETCVPATGSTAPQLTRSEINSRNASKRWHKQDHAQREMPMMGVVGGSDHAAGCKSDANDANRIFASDPKLKKEYNHKANLAKQIADDSQYVRITRAANEAAGLDLSRTQDYGMVRRWLQDGVDEDLMLDVIAVGKRPDVPHLGYFAPAMREALLAKQTLDTAEFQAWREARFDWADRGRKGLAPPADAFQVARSGIANSAEPNPRQLTAAESAAWERALSEWMWNGRKGPLPAPAQFRREAA